MTTSNNSETYCKALLSAANTALDPHAERDDRTRKYVTAAGTEPDVSLLIALAKTADQVQQCDLVYLIVGQGAANLVIDEVAVGAVRDGLVYIYRGCRLWQPIDPDAPMLILSKKGYFAAAAEEIEHHMGRPAKTLEAGYGRAWRKLHEMATSRLGTPCDAVYVVPTAQTAS